MYVFLHIGRLIRMDIVSAFKAAVRSWRTGGLTLPTTVWQALLSNALAEICVE
jgi:hypothetical protein